MTWPDHPSVHEVFTWVWLDELSRRLGRPVTLADVPDEVWDAIARPGFDAVWLMGVWERSPAGAAIARAHPAMQAAQREALPDVTDGDVVGSAYCIRSYQVDARLGGDEGLAIAREQLARRGARLVLDFVPNHVAPDHPWVTERPELLIAGTEEELAADPGAFVRTAGGIFACGRDPYFPPWPDVVQIDASTVEARQAAAATLSSISSRCDGVRCDMAMLVLDDVFHHTWGERAKGGPAPDGGRGYWPTVLESVRHEHPDLAVWAEAYWDLEPVLVAQGFDACYDKRLYDRLVHREGATAVRDHLRADPDGQRRTVRFIENHDEPRAGAVLEPAVHRAAAVTALTLPGVALVHEGQAEGRRIRVPVTLGRRPHEEPDAELAAWYGKLLDAFAGGLRRGAWRRLDVHGWPDNTSAERLVAWQWEGDPWSHLVVVNLSPDRADGLVAVELAGPDPVVLDDLLSGAAYTRHPTDLTDGLYVALDGWRCHLLRSPAGALRALC